MRAWICLEHLNAWQMRLAHVGIQLCPMISHSILRMMFAVNTASKLSVLWGWRSLVAPWVFLCFLCFSSEPCARPQRSTNCTVIASEWIKPIKMCQKFQPRMIEGGLVVCAPPCSLYSAACQSVHQRTPTNPGGNLAVYKVRLAHRIWANMAPGLHSIFDVGLLML